MQHGELRSYRGSSLVNEFFLRFSSFNFNDTFKTGEALFYIFKLVFCNIKWQWDSRKRGSKWKWYLSSACVKFQCWWWNGETRCLPLIQSRARSPSQPKIHPKKTNKKETMIERWNPLFADSGRASSEIPEWLQEFKGNFGGWWSSWTQRFTRQFFSWSIFRAHIQETWGSGEAQCFYSFPWKT